MNTSIMRIPRWAIAVVVCAMLLSLIALSGPGYANAQDGATPTATEAPAEDATEEPTVEVVTADEEATEAADAAFAVGDTPLVADGPLNVRESAGLDAELLFQLEAGAEVEITDGPIVGDGYSWYEVLTADDETGWAAGEFLGSEVVVSDFAAGDEVVIADGPLNVRDDSSLDGEVILQLEVGEGGTIVSGPVAADDYNWYEIEIDSETTGWVAGEFLALADGGTVGGDGQFEVGDAVRVAVEDLNFRAEPSLDADVLDTLTLDALFLVQDGPVTADGYTWYQVFNYYYGEGWVAGELVTLEPEGFPGEEGA